MVRRPNLFKYLPIRLRIYNCWDAFLHISDICLSKFRWESTVMPKSSDTNINTVVKTLENDSINLIDRFSKNLMKTNPNKIQATANRLKTNRHNSSFDLKGNKSHICSNT
jgi:hypothetical protein